MQGIHVETFRIVVGGGVISHAQRYGISSALYSKRLAAEGKR
jgi:hypothetical protein